MTDKLESLRETFADVVEDQQEGLWEHADWHPPLSIRNGEKVVDEDYYEEFSDREWAMFIAGKLEAFGAAKTMVDAVDSDDKQDESSRPE